MGSAEKALALMRGDAWLWPRSGERTLDLVRAIGQQDPALGSRLAQALDAPFVLHFLDEARQRTRVALLPSEPPPEACLPAYIIFEPWVPWEQDFLLGREACYRAAGHALAAAAAEDLGRLRSELPPALDRGL